MPLLRASRRTMFLLVLMALPVRLASAQYLTRPRLPWETLTTRSFTFHFPSEMRDWTIAVAQRMEAVAASVNAVVGNAPKARVTVMVEDPANVPNGFALPFLEAPVIFMWPTPPGPTPTFGTHRGWGEVLAVHEYAHIAHLTIPTRNPNERRFWSVLPSRIGPVARKSPSWVIEGYATLVEGKLTGSGRPNSVGRAAVLRQWALEGRLPTYGQLDNAAPFYGGAMRYLAGSAFLEWLEARKGDSSLTHVWRRMSARQSRGFSAAFSGVFGASPDDLYGKFFVDVIAKSLEIRRQLTTAGLVEGELFQKLYWGTGDPAVSPDGKQLAVVLRSSTAPARLVVWKTDEEPDSAIDRERAALRRRDSLDVPAIDSFPRSKRAVATLRAVAGRSYEHPRWFRDGVRLLVSRDELIGDGATRPDLFIWNSRSGGVRRVTRGAGIRSADPSPDGLTAAAVRCASGVCNLVVVDLATGRWRVLAPGSLETVWHRPRWSPDGTRIAAGYQIGGEWTVVVVDARTGERRQIGPRDGAARYTPSWTASGTALLAVSERGGVPNLERLEVDGAGVTTLTRVLGAVLAPDVSRADGRAYFLTLHSKGYDVRRLSLASPAVSVVALDPDLAPAAPKRAPATSLTFAPRPIPAPTEYGLGHRAWRVLPGGTRGADGSLVTLMAANIDPVARFSVVAQAGYGDRGAWRGGSLGAAMRRLPVDLEGALWYTNQRPSEQHSGDFAPPSADAEYIGGGVIAQRSRDYTRTGFALRAGVSVGTVRGPLLEGAARLFGFGEARARASLLTGNRVLTALASTSATLGETDGQSWSRTVSSGELVAGTSAMALRGSVTMAHVTGTEAGDFGRDFEQFLVGGYEVPYFDRAFLSQRIPVAGLPTGFVRGRKVGTYRVGLRGFQVEPFVAWLAAGDSLDTWKRVIGLERSFAFAALGFARLPEVRGRVGAVYSVDEPYAHKARLYAGVTYSP